MQKQAIVDEIELQRIIEDRILQRDMMKLNQKYRFPHKNWWDFYDWYFEDKEGRKFRSDLMQLFEKHSIPRKWQENIRAKITKVGFEIIHAYEFPQVSYNRNGDVEINITRDTDLSNPLVLNYIKHVQKLSLKPPEPKYVGRKLDWAPLYEWKIRHPFVTNKDIAKALSLSEGYVRRKLSEEAVTYEI